MRRLGIAEGLQHRASAEDRLLNARTVWSFLRERRQMVKKEVGAFRFSRATFPADDYALRSGK